MDARKGSLVMDARVMEVGEAAVLTMGAPGPNMEYGPGGARPLVHF